MQYAKEEKEEEVDEDKYLTETTENWIQKYSNQYSSQVQEWMMKLVQAVAKFRN